jgi:Tfp pilus assembly protein PilX
MKIPLYARKYRTRTPHRRRGMVLIIFLVCLAVAAAMIAATARIALTAHRATQTVSFSAQARLLAESGAERAAAKLTSDAAYSGETWTIPAVELGGQDAGVVRIQVKPAAGEEKRRTVTVQADFPDDPVHYARQEKEIIVDLP